MVTCPFFEEVEMRISAPVIAVCDLSLYPAFSLSESPEVGGRVLGFTQRTHPGLLFIILFQLNEEKT